MGWNNKKTKAAGSIFIGLIALVMIFFALFDWNSLRPPLARAITDATGRPAAIDGDLKVHLWSWNPTAEINGINLKNPSWADRELLFAAKRITIAVSLGRLLRGQVVLSQIVLLDPTINLQRDSQGRTNWELGNKSGTPNRDTQPVKIPTIRRLIIENGQLHVIDQIRQLTFDGSLVAAEQSGKDDANAFKVRCSGTLNAKPFKFQANGAALLELNPDKPYSFTLNITAADIKVETHVTVLKPFDLGLLDAKLAVSGNDLADLFYLTGLALPNTPPYRLAATVHVDGTKFKINHLVGRLGSSDLAGQADVDISGGKPKLTAKLSSNTLDIVDLAPALGQSAPTSKPTSRAATDNDYSKHQKANAARSPAPPANTERLLPDADLQTNRVRGMDADVTYQAAAVSAPNVPMKALGFHLLLNNGLFNIDPLTFALKAGKFSGKVQIDARQDVPVSTIDMHIERVDLSQFKFASTKESPLDGSLQGRFKFHGAGSSIRKFAATSDGAISIVIPHGQIRAAFAELTGINVLKALGLLLSKEEDKTDIRCGIIDFKDHQGSLNSTTVYLDTTNVLITGRGKIDLSNEHLDLALQGDPKKIRFLRLRSPIALQGTLLHPSVGLTMDKLAEQVGASVALGVVLTPVAAALAFIDPGLAKDKDCSTVLAQADAGIDDKPQVHGR